MFRNLAKSSSFTLLWIKAPPIPFNKIRVFLSSLLFLSCFINFITSPIFKFFEISKINFFEFWKIYFGIFKTYLEFLYFGIFKKNIPKLIFWKFKNTTFQNFIFLKFSKNIKTFFLKIPQKMKIWKLYFGIKKNKFSNCLFLNFQKKCFEMFYFGFGKIYLKSKFDQESKNHT